MRLHDAWHIRLEAEREAKIKSLEKEVARLRLTDAEREAIDDAIYLCEAEAGLFGERAAATKWATCAATLRGVSERMGGER